MKKIKILGVLVLLMLIAFALSACGGCKHIERADAAVAATCTESGLTAGSHCSECGEVLVKQEVVPATGHTEVIQEEQEATCTESGLTEGRYCKDCGEVFAKQSTISALGHTTTSGTCSRCGKNMGDWTIGYYVDEFDQPTNQAFVTNAEYYIGKFSNSATTDSLLYAQVLVDKDDIAIFLYEYGRSLVKNSSSRSNEWYNITIKTSDGKKTTFEGVIYTGGDRIFFYDEDESAVLQILKSGKTVSFYIEEHDRTVCNYLFTLESSNFAELYKKIK